MHRVDEFQEQNIPQQQNRQNENATECQRDGTVKFSDNEKRT
jgi:hypothetical protein